MDDQQRAHVELIVSRGSKLALRTFQGNLQAMLQEHSAAGRLQSGLTIRRAVTILEEQIRDVVPAMIARVRTVNRTPDAFSVVKTALEKLVASLEAELPAIVLMADGKQPGQAVTPSVQKAVDQLVLDWKENFALEVQLARAEFLMPGSEPVSEPDPAPAAPGAVSSPQSPNDSYTADRGRLAAAFWDDLWVFIAIEVFAGRIDPESQSTILAAMLQWTSDRGHSLSESSARPRARKLAKAARKELKLMEK